MDGPSSLIELDTPLSLGGLTYLRDLTAGDILALENTPAPPVADFSKVIARMTATHHNVARLMADGRKDSDIAAVMGKSKASIERMRGDPSVKELVSHYSGVKDALYYDMHTRMATIGVNAAEIINDKLEDHIAGKPGSVIALREAREVLEMVLDRTGNPAMQGHVHVNVESVKADVMSMFTKRTDGVMIDVSPDSSPLSEAPAPILESPDA